MKKKLIITLVSMSVSVFSQESSDLEKKIEALNIPSDKVTNILTEDKLYVVNERYSSLMNRHELTILGANNFTADSHLSSQQVAATYRYHLNSDWSFGVRFSKFNNELTKSGKALFDSQKILPDSDFARNSREVFANYNTVYGKLRLTDEQVVYFDQYVSLGVGEIKLSSDTTNVYSLDLGLSFWLGKHMSTRFGVKNEFYSQIQKTGKRDIHNMNGYFEIGYLFGTGDRG